MAHHYLGNRMTTDRKWMEQLGFELEDKGSMIPLWVVVDDCGCERPASLAEIVLWTSLTAPPAPAAPAEPMTWEQAVRKHINDTEYAERLLALPDDATAEQVHAYAPRHHAPVAPALKYVDDPKQTGVGSWCAPGPAAEQKRMFVLRFEDQDRGEAHYTDEAEARAMFARAEARGWNCHLFVHVNRVAPVAPAEPALVQIRLKPHAHWAEPNPTKDEPTPMARAEYLVRTWPNRYEMRLLYTAPPDVPPGWVLVPVEPTDAMIDAPDMTLSGRAGVYRAMLAAAPKAAPVAPASVGWTDFVHRTNEEYAAWCKITYTPDTLDIRGMPTDGGLHGLWAWQEQERRKMAAPVAPADLERMRHIANEWADMATSGHMWLRNIVAGVSTPADALANSTQALQHCRAVNDAPKAEPAAHTVSSKPTSIQLTAAEIQSGYSRVRWAEGLIRQLPTSHEGRNSWLLNYGIGPKDWGVPVAPADPTQLRRADGALSGVFIETVASGAATVAADLRNWLDFLPGHAQPTIEQAVRLLETRP